MRVSESSTIRIPRLSSQHSYLLDETHVSSDLLGKMIDLVVGQGLQMPDLAVQGTDVSDLRGRGSSENDDIFYDIILCKYHLPRPRLHQEISAY